MSRIPRAIRKSKKTKVLGEPEIIKKEEYDGMDLNARVEIIRSLIPIGLIAVYEELDREVDKLAGKRYNRKVDEGLGSRHGTNRGTAKIAGQKIPIRVPRVRKGGKEIPLESYTELHKGKEPSELLLKRVLYGISCRNYEAAAESVPGAIGLSSSTVSRQFIEASAEELRRFREKDLSAYDIAVIFLDGKTFAEDTMVIALGVTMNGEKVVLGFVQTQTENKRVISQFLSSLIDRGLDMNNGILFVIDGAKGLRSSIREVFEGKALVQRCQWHKRENVVSHLPRSDQGYWRKRLQKAYQRPTYEEARRELRKIRGELELINQSAVASLDEGFEETLTLHRLGMFSLLGRSLKTTNCLESINAMAEERCCKVDSWKNSSQKQRWLASTLIDIEPRLRKLLGHRHLPKLRDVIMKELKINSNPKRDEKVA
ncbi:MAG: transposase [Candidatus Krumholzibacteria bacterium]|nr:transposase [Candidatus Krumholzibacteria bacterium]